MRDIQRRLARLGFDVGGDGPGMYGPATEAALHAFQDSRGLRTDGICGIQTWSALVEAGYRLGDRFLYLRAPMLRGEDVAEFQRRLGALGFDAGRVDGIFGRRTVDALLDFQRNAGLTADGICGPDVLAALARLGDRLSSDMTVAVVREEEALRDTPRDLLGRRVAVGETGGLAGLADALGRTLLDQGALVAVLHHPDESRQAEEANRFDAEAFVAVALIPDTACRAAYYGAEGFESVGGKRLAHLIVEEVGSTLGADTAIRSMRLPILRETRMPAVLCELGPPRIAVERAADLVAALRRAMARWSSEPLDRS